uniref:S.cerevisiae BNI1, N0647, APL1, N0665, N0670, LYP1, PIK1, N0800, N0809, N0810, N0815, N0820, POL2, and N0830 genes n=1 Tax=Saccharomyces cerevisiae TaxID=4932 RepID=A2NYC4_YEASX|nr:unnamed protein product [Saccharomyces cerevisiae]
MFNNQLKALPLPAETSKKAKNPNTDVDRTEKYGTPPLVTLDKNLGAKLFLDRLYSTLEPMYTLELPAERMVISTTALNISGRTFVPEFSMLIIKGDEETNIPSLSNFGSLYGTKRPMKNSERM